MKKLVLPWKRPMRLAAACGLILALATILDEVRGQPQNVSATPAQQAPSIFDRVLDAIHSGDENACETAAMELDRERDACGQALLQILRAPDSSKLQRNTAAYCLGKLRYSQAVSDLSQLRPFAFRYTTHLTQLPPIDTVSTGLEEIGQPAVPFMITNIETNLSPAIRIMSADVLVNIEGSEIASMVLSNEIVKLADPETQGRLRAALGEIQNATPSAAK